MSHCYNCDTILDTKSRTRYDAAGYQYCIKCGDELLGPVNPPPTATMNQVGGNHYKDMAIQPAEFSQKNKLGFLEGEAIKYISRHQKKNRSEDIRKAIHCLEMILEIDYNATT